MCAPLCDSGDDECTQPLLLHWDGTAWSSMLFDKSQSNSVWAGGVEFPQGDPPDPTGNGLYLRTG